MGNEQALAFMQGLAPPVPDQAIWQWDTTTNPQYPVVSGFPSGIPGTSGFYSKTKTGMTPTDLQNFIGVPLQFMGTTPRPVPDDTLYSWLRYAEDDIEQNTNILLCQTWIASPPCPTPQIANIAGMITVNGGEQQIGIDYDLEDAAYDFMFPRAQDEGWMFNTLRYRPVQSFAIGASGMAATAGITAVKNTAYIYPLLNQYMRIPPGWNVEDKDFGFIRYVPAQNVQMLPLFAMELTFMGFAENVPGGLWLQYTAGLTKRDYDTRFAFMKELVLLGASLIALSSVQGTINFGLSGSR
jgi:hypothetical protein